MESDTVNVFKFNQQVCEAHGFQMHYYYWNVKEQFYGHNFEYSFLSFYLDHKEYEHYWLVEYDVFCKGDWNEFLSFYDENRKDVDYYGTHIDLYDKNEWAKSGWDVLQTYIWPNGALDIKEDKTNLCRCFNPICRLSNTALNVMIEHYKKGMYGFFEIAMPTIFYNAGLKMKSFSRTASSEIF